MRSIRVIAAAAPAFALGDEALAHLGRGMSVRGVS